MREDPEVRVIVSSQSATAGSKQRAVIFILLAVIASLITAATLSWFRLWYLTPLLTIPLLLAIFLLFNNHRIKLSLFAAAYTVILTIVLSTIGPQLSPRTVVRQDTAPWQSSVSDGVMLRANFNLSQAVNLAQPLDPNFRYRLIVDASQASPSLLTRFKSNYLELVCVAGNKSSRISLASYIDFVWPLDQNQTAVSFRKLRFLPPPPPPDRLAAKSGWCQIAAKKDNSQPLVVNRFTAG